MHTDFKDDASFVRDHRCVLGDCQFPDCPCDGPPHEPEREDPGRTVVIAIALAFGIAAILLLVWSWLVHEKLHGAAAIGVTVFLGSAMAMALRRV
jgi:hypothetical protein